jgi:hypothetical protein
MEATKPINVITGMEEINSSLDRSASIFRIKWNNQYFLKHAAFSEIH